MDGDWTYVFSDLRTGAEKATLPLTGVSLQETLAGVGAGSGYVTTLEDEVRSLGPWAATTPKRSMVHAELDDEVEWGGIVWGRKRSDSASGLALTFATFESYLAYLLLTADRTYSNKTAAFMLADVVAVVQGYAGANINLSVQGVGSGTGRDRTWAASDLKTVLDLMDSFRATQTPIEFRVAVGKDPSGVYTRTLIIGEPRLGTPLATSGLEWSYPGEVTSWTYAEDGTANPNTALGAATPDDTNAAKLLSLAGPEAVGSDEIAAGFPRVMKGYAHSEVKTQAGLDTAVLGDLLDGLSQGEELSGLRVHGDVPLNAYNVGDDVRLSITHPSMEEWPEPATMDVRILGRKVAVGAGTRPTTVDLTVGALGLGRLPRSVTLTAQLRGILSRLTTLETKPK